MKTIPLLMIITVMCSCATPSKKMITVLSINVESYHQKSKSSGRRGDKKVTVSKPDSWQYRIDVKISDEAPTDAVLKARFAKNGNKETIKLINARSSVVTPFYSKKILIRPKVAFFLEDPEGKQLDNIKVILPKK